MYDAGISRFEAGKFTRFTTKEGLFDNGAFQIFEDARGYFWVGCNRGIYRVAKKELNDFAEGRSKRVTSVPYGKGDGMLNAECNGGGQPAGLEARDGKLWFPTQQGVVVVEPEAMAFNTRPPPVVIEEFVVGREAVAFRDGVNIGPGQESFEIHYAGLSFIRPEQVRFRYKLEGLDADWVDADTRRVAYYTHLPPGSYTFRVVAANTDGVWNWEGASVAVVVAPPFWRTWWFVTLVAAGLAAVAAALYRHRIGRLRQAHAAREAFSRKLIETQEQERKRIAAELHDSLGQDLIIIKNWALLGLSTLADDAPSAARLREISETASQAINEVREIAYNLGPYQLDRLGLIRTIEEMVERVSASSSILFSFDAEPLDGVLSKESEINLYRVIQEAVSNTVKHSGASRAVLTIRATPRDLHVIIRDDGKGFVPETPPARGPYGRGFGLVGMAERVRLLGGKWEIQSAPGAGTTIIIRLLRVNGLDHAGAESHGN
jgi:signal transduction histidine kinase